MCFGQVKVDQLEDEDAEEECLNTKVQQYYQEDEGEKEDEEEEEEVMDADSNHVSYSIIII